MPTTDDYHDLSYLDKPMCPHCDRELGVAPGMGALAFKCTRHGKFASSEFEANALDVMQRRQSDTNDIAALIDMLPMLFILIPILGAEYLTRKLNQVADL